MDPIADAAVDAGISIPKGTGYFASDSDLPFQAPNFDAISEDDYIPAFEQAMRIHKAEIEAIKDILIAHLRRIFGAAA